MEIAGTGSLQDYALPGTIGHSRGHSEIDLLLTDLPCTEPGRGTGLGMSPVREILSLTGITIRETGIPGKGARFEISIPNGEYRRNVTGNE